MTFMSVNDYFTVELYMFLLISSRNFSCVLYEKCIVIIDITKG